jgi:maleylpyruvate isomerase
VQGAGERELQAELSGTHARLLASVRCLDDDQMREPSRLPEWTRAMLVAHLRFGAEAAVHGIDGAGAGAPSAMYPGGDAQRDAEIASGASLPSS